jgi:hypothetical protein
MKTLLFSLLPILFLFFLSCESDEVDYGLGEYYQEIATVLNDSAYLLDTGQTLCNINYKKMKALDAGKRVFLTYSYEKQCETFCDSVIYLHGLLEITQGKLKAVDEKDLDALPVEPVHLESVWLGSHYLNLRIYINYNSTPHSIGLFTDSTRLNADTVCIYFVHDLNGDLPGYPRALFLSFDLENILGFPDGKKNVSLNLNTGSYANKTYKFKY